MNKRCWVFSLVLCMSMLVAVAQEKKAITFFTYIAGDNNLDSFINGDLMEMKRVGSNDRINIVAEVHQGYNQAKKSRRYYVNKGSLTQVGDTFAADSGQRGTLFDALKWVHETYPSDMLVVVLWNHGSGPLNKSDVMKSLISPWGSVMGGAMPKAGRAVCYDDTTGHVLTDVDLDYAFSKLCTEYRGGKKIDIVAFDACLMAHAEVAYTLRKYANYMVASQQTIPGQGYGYDLALRAGADAPISARDFAVNMVHAYDNEYKDNNNDYTLSAVDLSLIGKVSNQVDRAANYLTKTLNTPLGFWLRLGLNRAFLSDKMMTFDGSGSVDLRVICSNILSSLKYVYIPNKADRVGLRDALKKVIAAVDAAVIAKVAGSQWTHASGLSIYFQPNRLDDTYGDLIWSKDIRWNTFLSAYHNILS